MIVHEKETGQSLSDRKVAPDFRIITLKFISFTLRGLAQLTRIRDLLTAQERMTRQIMK